MKCDTYTYKTPSSDFVYTVFNQNAFPDSLFYHTFYVKVYIFTQNIFCISN